MEWREFKAWLSGFEEAIDGRPTKKQWKKIKAKMARVNPDVETRWWGGFYHEPYRLWRTRDIYYDLSGGTTISAATTDSAFTITSGSTIMATGKEVDGAMILASSAEFDTYEEALAEMGRMDAAA